MICVLNYCIVVTISSSTQSSSSYSVVSCWVCLGSFQANFVKWNLKLLKIFWSSFSRTLPLYDSFDKKIAWSFLIIYSTIYFIYFQRKKNDFEFLITYWLKFQETLTILYVFSEDFLCETQGAGLNASVSKWKILIRNKMISLVIVVKETNISWTSKFILNGRNRITRGKLFIISFSSGCFTEVATFFKSY